MKSLNVGAVQSALDRLETEAGIPRPTIAASGYNGLEHMIAVKLAERFSLERRHEVENLIRNAIPAEARDLPIHVSFKP